MYEIEILKGMGLSSIELQNKKLTVQMDLLPFIRYSQFKASSGLPSIPDSIYLTCLLILHHIKTNNVIHHTYHCIKKWHIFCPSNFLLIHILLQIVISIISWENSREQKWDKLILLILVLSCSDVWTKCHSKLAIKKFNRINK